MKHYPATVHLPSEEMEMVRAPLQLLTQQIIPSQSLGVVQRAELAGHFVIMDSVRGVSHS